MANLKCHMPIMVNIAVHAMRFPTGPEFPRELSFGVKIGGPKRGSGKNLALVIWLFYGLGVANLNCHMPIMVNAAIFAMIFATGPELPQGLSFVVGEGGSYRGSGKEILRW